MCTDLFAGTAPARRRNLAHADCCALQKILTHAAGVPFVQDELDYEHAVQADKEKKPSARAKTKGIKASNLFIVQAFSAERVGDIKSLDCRARPCL